MCVLNFPVSSCFLNCQGLQLAWFRTSPSIGPRSAQHGHFATRRGRVLRNLCVRQLRARRQAALQAQRNRQADARERLAPPDVRTRRLDLCADAASRAGSALCVGHRTHFEFCYPSRPRSLPLGLWLRSRRWSWKLGASPAPYLGSHKSHALTSLLPPYGRSCSTCTMPAL